MTTIHSSSLRRKVVLTEQQNVLFSAALQKERAAEIKRNDDAKNLAIPFVKMLNKIIIGVDDPKDNFENQDTIKEMKVEQEELRKRILSRLGQSTRDLNFAASDLGHLRDYATAIKTSQDIHHKLSRQIEKEFRDEMPRYTEIDPINFVSENKKKELLGSVS